ncbi:MAG TPA: NAD(P)-dependent oxidoreductase [Gemmatimonadales bacterium]|nr:NAD(P)-dependent oxidoreductase [Gemmatimonadales bacterium]
MRVGFIGLGSMGLPMAQHLLRAGHELVVSNRTRTRADEPSRMGARVAASPREAADGVEVLVTMLSDDVAVEGVLFGDEGALAALGRGAIHLAMSTTSPALARRLTAAHDARGQAYVAAPVFGRPEMAQAAKLWIVAAGSADAIGRCRPLLDAMGQGVETVGTDPAAASVVKIAGNFLLASAIEAMGEAFTLVRKHGIEPARFLEIANGRLLRSPIYENYGGLIAAERYEPAGFKLAHGLKDVRLALDAGDDVAAPLPLASLMRDHFLAAVAWGWADIDWAALARVSAVNAGLSR